MANRAVYSGSFNPLHIGHLAIIRHLIEESDYDMVYLIVSPKNPLKDGISSASAADRYNAAIAAVNRHFSETFSEVEDCVDGMPPRKWSANSPLDFCNAQPAAAGARGCLTEGKAGAIGTTSTSKINRVLVDDIELTMPEPHYTIRTLDALKEREPGNTFTFVMGADSLADIRRWKDYSRILSDFGVAVFPRKGHDIASIKADLLKENPSYRITLLNAEMVDISSTTIREAIASGDDPSAWLA